MRESYLEDNKATLLEAILDKPDDVLARLAYADWCNDNKEVPRAEFIRVQVALFSKDNPNYTGIDRREELLGREGLLDTLHRERFLDESGFAGAPELLREEGITKFTQGFVSIVWPSFEPEIFDWFMEHAEEISGKSPITHLFLAHTPPDGPIFADGDFAHIACFKNLKYLNLNGSGITDEGLKHLTNFKNLETLEIYNTAITDAGRRQILGYVKSGQLPNLKSCTGINEAEIKKAHAERQAREAKASAPKRNAVMNWLDNILHPKTPKKKWDGKFASGDDGGVTPLPAWKQHTTKKSRKEKTDNLTLKF